MFERTFLSYGNIAKAKFMKPEKYLNLEQSTLLPHVEHLRMICSQDDPDLVADMISGETDLEGFVGHVLEFILADEADLEGIKAHHKRIAERRRRLESRVERLRTLLASVITLLPERKYRHALALVTAFDVDPRVIVQDESAIPSHFWIQQEPKLNESGIRKLLLQRQKRLDELARCLTEEEREARREEVDHDCPAVPGVSLGNGEISVRIRVA